MFRGGASVWRHLGPVSFVHIIGILVLIIILRTVWTGRYLNDKKGP